MYYIYPIIKKRAMLFSHLYIISPKQNGWHLADDFLKCISSKTCFMCLVQFLLKCVSKSSTNDKSSLVQIMPWYITGDRWISEPLMTNFTTSQFVDHLYMTGLKRHDNSKQTTYQNHFLEIMHWYFFSKYIFYFFGVYLAISQHWLMLWFGAYCLTNADEDQRCIA